MKSFILGLFVSMVSFQVWAANEITQGSYIARDEAGVERVSITLGAPGAPSEIPALRIVADIPGVGRIIASCKGSYGIRGDILMARVACNNQALALFLGGSDITVSVNLNGATNARMAAGAPVQFNINEGTFESVYKLYRR